MPGSKAKADYYLTGQFITDGMKQEGIINLVDYIGMMEERMKKGESLDLYDESPAAINGENSGNQLNIQGFRDELSTSTQQIAQEMDLDMEIKTKWNTYQDMSPHFVSQRLRQTLQHYPTFQ